MQSTTTMMSLKPYSDKEKLMMLKYQIAKYAALQRSEVILKTSFKKKQFPRCSSVTMITKLEERFHTEEDEKPYHLSAFLYSENENLAQIIESVFYKTISQYSGTS